MWSKYGKSDPNIESYVHYVLQIHVYNYGTLLCFVDWFCG